MVFMKSATNMFEYALRIIHSHYNESMLTFGVKEYRAMDGIMIIFMQSIVYIALSALSLAMNPRKKKFSTKPGKSVDTAGKYSRVVKRTKTTDYGIDDIRSSHSLREHLNQCRLIITILALVAINISNKLMLYKSLDHMSYPMVAVIRSFRLFPSPLSIIGSIVSYRILMSTSMATIGIFIYLFSPEEGVESIYYLKKLNALDDPRAIQEYDKVKIVRMSLRFLYFYARDVLSPYDASNEEDGFIDKIINNELPLQDYSRPLKEQARTYYRTLLLLHGDRGNEIIGKERIKTVFKKIMGTNDKLYTPEMNYLALSFIKMISTGKNDLYFHAFLEKRKIIAASYLAFHSLMEVAMETGQIIICQELGIQSDLFVFGINLLSAVSLCFILLLYSFHESDWSPSFKKDIFIASCALYYIRRLSSQESFLSQRKDNTRMSLQIGMKFFSLFLSTIFYGHSFTIGQIIGLVFMFTSYLININMHSILLARWTLSGHLRKKCV
ncbi:hypothetical protein NEPAR06_1575 [Nematocida parisii]|nr:hypothetical protein NEPAR06_1575 [Nematocida parisii]